LKRASRFPSSSSRSFFVFSRFFPTAPQHQQNFVKRMCPLVILPHLSFQHFYKKNQKKASLDKKKKALLSLSLPFACDASCARREEKGGERRIEGRGFPPLFLVAFSRRVKTLQNLKKKLLLLIFFSRAKNDGIDRKR